MCENKDQLEKLLASFPKSDSVFQDQLNQLCLRTIAETDDFAEVKKAIRVFSYTWPKESDDVGKKIATIFIGLNSNVKLFAAQTKSNNETTLAN